MSWFSVPERKAMTRHLQFEATKRKAEAETDFFWNQVEHNRSRGDNSIMYDSETERMFGSKDSSRGLSPGEVELPVERSGAYASNASVMAQFEELKGQIPDCVFTNLIRMGISSPSPIQKHAIPSGLAGFDLMCCSQTGSGKTVAFLIPVVARLNKENEKEKIVKIDNRGSLPRCVVIAPTRELVSQIFIEARKLAHHSGLKICVVYGGADIRPQLMDLTTGCDILVATPGRLCDLIDRQIISMVNVELLVLDEADRMMDMGFEPQIRQIVVESGMPPKENRQTFMFSATFPDDIQVLARDFLRDYVWIGVGRVGSTVDNIKQVLVQATSDLSHKVALLMDQLKQSSGRTLIFVQRKKTASWVCNCLTRKYGIPADEIHGDRSQVQREVALQRFRDGFVKVLVATDVASRGLDIPSVTHVIQFDMPISAEDFDTYIHRIGRTGRMGQPGRATSLFVPGKEVGEGNGKLAPLLLNLFKETQQDVPDWFAALPDHMDENNGPSRVSNIGNRGHFRNNGANHWHNNTNSNRYSGQSNFGARDIRGFSNSTSMQYSYYPTPDASFGNEKPLMQHNSGPNGFNNMNDNFKQYGFHSGHGINSYGGNRSSGHRNVQNNHQRHSFANGRVASNDDSVSQPESTNSPRDESGGNPSGVHDKEHSNHSSSSTSSVQRNNDYSRTRGNNMMYSNNSNLHSSHPTSNVQPYYSNQGNYYGSGVSSPIVYESNGQTPPVPVLYSSNNVPGVVLSATGSVAAGSVGHMSNQINSSGMQNYAHVPGGGSLPSNVVPNGAYNGVFMTNASGPYLAPSMPSNNGYRGAKGFVSAPGTSPAMGVPMEYSPMVNMGMSMNSSNGRGGFIPVYYNSYSAPIVDNGNIYMVPTASMPTYGGYNSTPNGVHSYSSRSYQNQSTTVNSSISSDNSNSNSNVKGNPKTVIDLASQMNDVHISSAGEN